MRDHETDRAVGFMFNKVTLFWKLTTAVCFVISSIFTSIAITRSTQQPVFQLERKELRVIEWQVKDGQLKILTDSIKCNLSYKFKSSESPTIESIIEVPLPSNVTVLYSINECMSASNVLALEVNNSNSETIILSNGDRRASTKLYIFAAIFTLILTLMSFGMLKVCRWLNRKQGL